MAKILSNERVVEYSKEFKAKVVELSHALDVDTIDIAYGLGLHPVMVYRWRQEYKEGRLVVEPSRKVSMTMEHPTPPPNKKKQDELKQLKKENAKLKKENDLLKKWQGYLKQVRQNDSDS